jgi:hypothetical protein
MPAVGWMGQRQRTARSEAVDRIPVGLAEFKATEPAFEPAVAEMSRPVRPRTALSLERVARSFGLAATARAN